MYQLADGSELTREQMRDLDDELFASNPSAYWRARIDALLADPPAASAVPARVGEIVAAGLSSDILKFASPTADERDLQRRLDAFALRHHIAEALVRLMHAVSASLTARERCIWASLTVSPTSAKVVVDDLRSRAHSDTDPLPLNRVFLPAADQPIEDHVAGTALEALRVAWSWVEHAMTLMVSDGLDVNAGHNKLKHGLAVRGRDDQRVEVTAVAPDADGNIPLSAFETSLPVVDDIAAVFLTRQTGRANPLAGSWEMTVLNLRPGPILAEALMLNLIYGAVFAVAAERHFAGRDVPRPQHPGLPLGPKPERIARGVDGMRSPLTRPAGASDPRPSVIQRGRQTVPFTFSGEVIAGIVVDDPEVPGEPQADA